jgi:hypothetical protein
MEFYSQVIRSEGAMSDVRLEEVLPIVGADLNTVKTHRVPMPIDVLLPSEQTCAERSIVRCKIAIASHRGQIHVYSDRSGDFC